MRTKYLLRGCFIILHSAICLLAVGGGFSARAQTTIFEENFDGGYVGAFNTGPYSGGNPTGITNSVIASGGNPDGAWQETMTTTTASDYYGGQVQLESVSGNTDTNPADYVVSFDAKGSQAATVKLVIQTWPNPYFGGTGPVVNGSFSAKLNNANTWQTFSFPLSLITQTNPTGATWQFSFQIVASQWGGPGHTDTVTIDNIILKNIVVVPAIALSSSANPSIFNHGATFAAQVQTNGVIAGNAAGKVVFYSASGPFSTNTLMNGSATSSVITNLPIGADLITAIYSGGNYPTRTNTLIQLVSTLTTGQCMLDWNRVYQRIDGFGASSAFSVNTWTPALADMFFSTNTGIGLSLLRTQIQPPTTTNAVAFASTTEIGLMQLAHARGASIWSTPWSPPVFCKDSNTLNGGNYLGTGNDDINQLYAAELAGYVANLKQFANIPLYAISIQNEPDVSTTYPSCLWTGQQYHDFATNLFNALMASNVASTKILLPEGSSWNSDYSSTAMSDPNVAAEVGIIAEHNYDGPNFNTGSTASPAALPSYGKSLWETEVSTGDAYDGGITNAIYWATRIHLFMTVAQANAWHYWWLIDQGADNQGLTDGSGNPAKRMFALGNFSRFVRPGYYRIGVTNASGALISAYQETNSGAFAIVAVNTNASIAISQTFTLTNFLLASSTLTTWVTSISVNATNSQTPVAISGSSFTYTLPALSVVTFVGRAIANIPPPLSVMESGSGGPQISWPATGNYILLQNSNLVGGNWTTSSYSITTFSGTNRITINPPKGNLFFRLAKP